MATTRVVLEVAPKRAFASAIDWPGWSRGGKTPDDALVALREYASRYAKVARRAKLTFDPGELEVVQRVKGGSGTEFGVPGVAAAAEREPVSDADLDRLVALLRASWATFDATARAAVGVELTKGPRGGGRELDKIVGHVREAESAYLGQLGSRPPPASDESPAKPMTKLRSALLETLAARVHGEPLPNPRNTKKPWSPRYTVRRAAWHVLDHAWEIEDRSAGG